MEESRQPGTTPSLSETDSSSYPTAEITINDVIVGMEGPICFSECREEDLQCQLEPGYPVQEYWKSPQGKIERERKQVDFEKLVKTTPHSGSNPVK